MSLFSIDEKRIKEKLREVASSKVAYYIWSANLETQSPHGNEPPTIEVGGIAVTTHPQTQRARAELDAVRRTLRESGILPLSNEDLEREINATRGR